MDNTRPINKENCSMWLGRISEKVLGRKVYPYILRHSRATELYTNASIPDKLAQKFLGHSSSMSDVYTHLSNKDVKEVLAKTIYETEDIAPEKKAELQKELDEMKKEQAEMKSNMERLSKLAINQNKLLKSLNKK
jgi:DNA-binding transcriptional MerR regulator